MTRGYLISANTIADMDRYTNEYLPVGSETLTKYDARPVVVAFDPDPVAGVWSDDHPFVAEFPSTDAARAWRHDEPSTPKSWNDCETRSSTSTPSSSRPSSIPRTSSDPDRRDTTVCYVH